MVQTPSVAFRSFADAKMKWKQQNPLQSKQSWWVEPEISDQNSISPDSVDSRNRELFFVEDFVEKKTIALLGKKKIAIDLSDINEQKISMKSINQRQANPECGTL